MRLAVVFGPCVQVACLWVLKSPDGPASEKLGFRAGGGSGLLGGGHGSAMRGAAAPARRFRDPFPACHSGS